MSERTRRQPQEQRDIDVSSTRTRTRGRHAIKFRQRRPDPLADGDQLCQKMARDELCDWIEQNAQRLGLGADSQQAVEPHSSFFQNQAGFGSLAIIEPPFNFNTLMRLPRENNMLRQCVDAMVTNCDGHGWRLEYVGPEEQMESREVQDEERMLRDFLEFPNADHSLQELRQRLRRDLETLGNAFIEVSQDEAGRMALMAHVPAHSVRLTMADQELVETRVMLPREGRAREQRVRRRFRRFVQINGSQMIWFKEHGDPRDVSSRTGRAGEEVPEEEKATAILHLRLYAPGTPYGVPRWINQMPAILGSRQAELTNLDFFQENAIPAMAILVSGGNVTQESIDDIEEQFTANRGRESFNRVLLVEAKGDRQSGPADGQLPAPKVDMKPLQSDRQKDALFQTFDQNNMTKIRSSFRLPPIFVGLCHSADTEYLTDRGWLVQDEIEDGDLLAQVSVETGYLSLAEPLARHEYDYEGDLIGISNRGVDALVTPNHRLLVQPVTARSRATKPWGMVRADRLDDVVGCMGGHLNLRVAAFPEGGEDVGTFDIPDNRRVNAWSPEMPSKNPRRDLDRYEVACVADAPPRTVVMDDMLEFVGYFVAEGSTTKTRGPVALSQKRGVVADAMVDCLRNLGFEPSVVEDDRGYINISICHGGLWQWLRENCGVGSADKRLPGFVLDLSARQRRIVWRAMMDGDGSVSTTGTSYRYATTSRVLADQFQQLCFSLGMRSSVRKVVFENPKWSDAYYVSLGESDTHMFNRDRHVSAVPYSGRVGCFTMPEGTLVTRRNGKVMVSGNSQDYTHATAKTSFEVAESQVFGPERQSLDDVINKKILSTFAPRFWAFRSNPPRISDPQDVMNAVQTFEAAGAMTPNVAIGLANEFFDLEIQEIKEAWGDVPFSLFKTMVTAGTIHLPDPDEENGELAAVAALLQRPSREERDAMAENLRNQQPQGPQPPQQQGGGQDEPGQANRTMVRTRTRTRRRSK